MERGEERKRERNEEVREGGIERFPFLFAPIFRKTFSDDRRVLQLISSVVFLPFSFFKSWLSKSYRPTGPLMLHKTAYVEYVPCGVLGVIAPWNYPFHNMLNHVISGLYSGNAVVSKIPRTPTSVFTNLTHDGITRIQS